MPHGVGGIRGAGGGVDGDAGDGEGGVDGGSGDREVGDVDGAGLMGSTHFFPRVTAALRVVF